MVIPLRIWLGSSRRPVQETAGGWSDADVARLRDGLKRGQGLAELAATLVRSPEEVAARICQFRPTRIATWPQKRVARDRRNLSR
jgi:hypothetical protein